MSEKTETRKTDARDCSRSLVIHVFEKKGVIIPGYADIIAEYITEDEDE